MGLKIFRSLNSGTFRLEYDTLGANCDLNHLHLEYLLYDRLNGSAIEECSKEKIR